MARRSNNEPPSRRGGKPAPGFRSRDPDSTHGAPERDGPQSRRSAPRGDRLQRGGPPQSRDFAPRRAEPDRRESRSDAPRDRSRRLDDHPRSAPRDRSRRSDGDYPRSFSRDRFSATSRGPNTGNARPDRDSHRQRPSTGRSDRPHRDDTPSASRRDAGSTHRGARGARGDAHNADAEGERLQKVLSRAGLASRREVEDWIRAGRITVNGEPAVLGVRVSPSDQLRLDGRLIRQRETTGGPTAFVCHRSPGESLTQPQSNAPTEGGEVAPSSTLIERLPTRAGRRFITISPMPRVDGGLELVTSDGELGVKLQRSVRHLVTQFSVRVLGELSPEQLQNILGGTLDTGEQIEVVSCEPAGGEGANRWYNLVARGASGKEVRQLFERQGALVSRVQRTHLGPIAMERTLGRGQFRELTPDELHALLAAPIDVES